MQNVVSPGWSRKHLIVVLLCIYGTMNTKGDFDGPSDFKGSPPTKKTVLYVWWLLLWTVPGNCLEQCMTRWMLLTCCYAFWNAFFQRAWAPPCKLRSLLRTQELDGAVEACVWQWCAPVRFAPLQYSVVSILHVCCSNPHSKTVVELNWYWILVAQYGK